MLLRVCHAGVATIAVHGFPHVPYVACDCLEPGVVGVA